MNCQDFETVIIEIARDRLLDAVARERGLAHVESCAHCAALLAAERALSGKLRALSTAAAVEEIPTRIETALLAAFEQRAAAPALASVPSKRRWLLAVAALLLLTFGLSLAGWFASSSEQAPTVADATPKVGAPAPTRMTETPQTFGQVKSQEDAVPQTARLNPSAKLERRQRRLLQASVNQPFVSADEPRESFTQFFPVHHGSELIPLESAQIIRIRLPRSNLISLGIPLNQERADETIQADVLVSNDGLARAIRLVY